MCIISMFVCFNSSVANCFVCYLQKQEMLLNLEEHKKGASAVKRGGRRQEPCSRSTSLCCNADL